DQRLVAVAQVHRAPDRRLLDLRAGPLPVRERERKRPEGLVLLERHPLRRHGLRWHGIVSLSGWNGVRKPKNPLRLQGVRRARLAGARRYVRRRTVWRVMASPP